MNLIDLLFFLFLALGLWSGWREGLIVQLTGLAGIGVGVWLAFRYGTRAGMLFGLEGATATVAGFIAILVLTVLVLALVGRLVRSLFRLTGLGIFDSLLGAVVGALKIAFVASLLFLAIDALNTDGRIIRQERIENSLVYRPLVRFARGFFPYFEELREGIDRQYLSADNGGSA